MNTIKLTTETAIPGTKVYDKGTFDKNFDNAQWSLVVRSTGKMVVLSDLEGDCEYKAAFNSGRLFLDGPEAVAPITANEIRVNCDVLTLGSANQYEAEYENNSGSRMYTKSLMTEALRIKSWSAGNTFRIYVDARTVGSVSGQDGWISAGYISYNEDGVREGGNINKGEMNADVMNALVNAADTLASQKWGN